MTARGVKFVVVGAAGFVVQLGALALLSSQFHAGWLPATIAAVECAIVHNFWWHARWTWNDRTGHCWVTRFAKFHAGTAVTSIGGNLAVMAILVPMLGVDVVPANAIAVLIVSLVNFVLADRWVFRGTRAGAAAAAIVLALPALASAAPPRKTLNAWTEFIANAERGIDARQPPFVAAREIVTEGETTAIDGGTVAHWRGAVLIPGATVDDLLDRLLHPGTPPPQDDVVASRVIARGPDFLHVYMRLVRHAIVTVSYDTEHRMTFERTSPARATARSVATRIEEVGGGDKGFLWKLNSYWRYEQAADGVLVSVDTYTLSRDVPLLVKPIAGPIVQRVARESMARTLAALREYMRRGPAQG